MVNTAFTAEKEYKSYTDIGPIEETDLKLSEVVSDPGGFNSEVITLDGVISDLTYKKLLNGRKFTLFNLNGDSDKAIKVYARGYIEELKDGDQIRIYGRYSKEKRFAFKKYKNVMKARKIQILGS